MKRIISIRVFFCLLAVWAISNSCMWIENARAESKPSPEVLDQRIQGNKELHEQRLNHLEQDIKRLEEKKASNEHIQRLDERINSLNTTLATIVSVLAVLVAILGIAANYYTKGIIKKAAETISEKTIKELLEKERFEVRLRKEIQDISSDTEKKLRSELSAISETIKTSFQQKLDDYYTLTQQRQALYEKIMKHGITPVEGEEFRELLKKTKPEERLYLADEWFIMGNIASNASESIRCYTNATDIKKDLGIGFYNRGVIYLEQGLLSEAISDFNTVIKLNPYDPEAYNARGNIYHQQKQFSEAIIEYNKAISIKPDYAGAYNNRGIAYSDQKQTQPALADYAKAIELEPSFSDAYYNRGNIYLEQKLLSEAIEDFTKALEYKVNDANLYNTRGTAYFEQNLFSEAISDYTKAIELKPDYLYAYYNLGEVYLKTEEPQLSLENYSKAIELDNGFIEAYADRSIVYERLGKSELATADKQKAEELRKQKQKDTPQE